MARSGIRFHPPSLPGSPEIDWALLRAFGKPDAIVAEGVDFGAARDVALRLSLQARIRSRMSRERLQVEIGSRGVTDFDRVMALNTGMLLQHEKVCSEIAETAHQSAVPLLLLKGMALRFLELTAPGSRRISDIDVLVPKASSEGFHQALIDSGCRLIGIRAPEHHLPVLRHPLGSAIEVHHEIDGVSLEGAGYATADQCLERDLVVEAGEFPDGVWLPAKPLLLAHLLAHGLSHHGKAPDSYPPLQLLADLQDLGCSAGDLSPIPDTTIGWIAQDVSHDEVAAALALIRDLSVGVRASEIMGLEATKAVLLRHFLAGSLSAEYLCALKLSRRMDRRPGQGRIRSVSANLWRALWLSRRQVEMLYGKPKTVAGYLGWRLWRPLDLISRTVRSLAASLRLKLRP